RATNARIHSCTNPGTPHHTRSHNPATAHPNTRSTAQAQNHHPTHRPLPLRLLSCLVAAAAAAAAQT
ncbi:hypothetical protein NPS74_23950, partial [Cutibacterium acnes subsp. acnes]|nr:hypothetical protein [Cutibacterium acnes subsp. acnes]